MSKLKTDHPITRRSALSVLGGGLITFTAWPAAIRAGSRAIPTFSFIVVSDTHLGRDDNKAAAEQWTKTAGEIDAASGDFVLHLGDIVDAGREPQYAIYKEIRKSIRKPIYEIPGNHDRQELFAKHIRPNSELAFDHQGVRFLLFNNSRYGEVDGFVSAELLKWLGQQCDEAATKGLYVIVVMHVPVHDNKDHAVVGSHVKPANGQKELYALLEQHKDRILATFHGHFHCGLRGWGDRTPLQEVVFPSALYNRNLLLTERKASGYNLPEFRPGFVLAKIDADGLSLRYKPAGVSETRDKLCVLRQLK
jgi:3',5'-cyclic AMP phosphodiesterase CpdA